MAIRTRGREQFYVSQFKVAISTNGLDWSDVEDEFGSMVVFEGNTYGDDIVTNPMPTPVKTRHVKLNIISSAQYPELSWAIDGCPVPTN